MNVQVVHEVQAVKEHEPVALVAVKERIVWLDMLRGFALLVISWLVQGKFYTLFSLLFGIGCIIFMMNAEKKGRSPRKLFFRRVLILQVLYRRWWFTRYSFGPMEWLWRRMTYGKWSS